MTLMEFSIVPLDKGVSLSAYVAKVLDVVDKSGLDYKLGPMGTVVEGEWDEVTALLTRCFRTLEAESDRITMTVKFDCRKGGSGRLTAKTDRVQAQLGRRLKTM